MIEPDENKSYGWVFITIFAAVVVFIYYLHYASPDPASLDLPDCDRAYANGPATNTPCVNEGGQVVR